MRSAPSDTSPRLRVGAQWGTSYVLPNDYAAGAAALAHRESVVCRSSGTASRSGRKRKRFRYSACSRACAPRKRGRGRPRCRSAPTRLRLAPAPRLSPSEIAPASSLPLAHRNAPSPPPEFVTYYVTNSDTPRSRVCHVLRDNPTEIARQSLSRITLQIDGSWATKFVT